MKSNLQLTIIKIVLAAVVIALSYFLYDSINSEIVMQKKIESVEGDVIEQLDRIRVAQIAYRDANNEFADNFDSLIHFMKYGTVDIVKEFGDPDDSTSVYRKEIQKVPVSTQVLVGYQYDSLPYVPHAVKPEHSKFIMAALKITQNKVIVPVFEVKDPHPFNPERRDNDNPLAVGSLVEATYSGNWK